MNNATLNSIYRDLGINIIWYEDYHELPELISKVFGLGYKSIYTDKLLDKARDYIIKIKNIEEELSKYNSVNTDPKVTLEFMAYSKNNSKKYQTLISDVDNILQVLQSRIPNNINTVMKFHSMEVPDYSNSNGYGDFS